MQKPKVSQDFTVEDIRKIREYDANRMEGWTAEQIIKDTQDKTRELIESLEQNKSKKVSAVC
jgi:hypothetical protein